MSRKTARRYALELIFQMPFHSDFDPVCAMGAYPEGNLPEITEAERDFALQSVSGVFGHLADIDGLIDGNSKGWATSRMNRVDLAALRLAFYEICFTDVPTGISVNEAVELAKMYSGEESGKFVNGILAQYAGRKDKRHA